MEIKVHDHILPNGRKFVGTDEELLKQLDDEIDEMNKQLAILTPKVEEDIRRSREEHRKLWNY